MIGFMIEFLSLMNHMITIEKSFQLEPMFKITIIEARVRDFFLSKKLWPYRLGHVLFESMIVLIG